MITSNIAYINRDGSHVPRIQQRRNRRVVIDRSDVVVDVIGNIDHPPVANLRCFGDPVEFHRGAFDTARRFGNAAQQARWCNGCPSRPACGTAALKRVNQDPALKAAFDCWSLSVSTLGGWPRYAHPLFTEFALTCRRRAWISTNDGLLSERLAADAKRKRQARAKQKKREKRGKPITIEAISALSIERTERHSALAVATLHPQAPAWLRNLEHKSIVFVCDVWLHRELLEIRYGEVSGGRIAAALAGLVRYQGTQADSLRNAVNVAIKRISRLQAEPAHAPVWQDVVG